MQQQQNPEAPRPEPIPRVDREFCQKLLTLENKPPFSLWKPLVKAVDYAALLHRFSDKGQTLFVGKPLPDGSNLEELTLIPGVGFRPKNGSMSLKRAYLQYQRWLQWLHYKGLVWDDPEWDGYNSERIDEELYGELTLELTAQLNEGKDKVRELDGTFDHQWHCQWVYDWRRGIHNGIHAMQQASQLATKLGENPFIEMHKAWNDIPLVIKVLSTLIVKEERFEESLRKKHVEDTLLEKRIFIISDSDYLRLGFQNAEGIAEEYRNTLRRRLAEMSKQMRDLFDFRLLRDWGYGRPWKKLYLVVGTKEKPALAPAVKLLQDLFSVSKLSGDLLGVHPLDQAELPEDDICVICQSEFEPDETILKTWCDHNFHPSCIFEFWDGEYKFDWKCPLCRYSPGELRDRVEFDAEKKDFKGNQDEVHMQRHRVEAGWNWDQSELHQMPTKIEIALVRDARLRDEGIERLREKRNGRGCLPDF